MAEWRSRFPTDDHTRWIGLPDLKSEQLAGLEWLPPGGVRDLNPASTTRPGTGGLEEVCEWAWRVAIGPILDDFEPPAGRPGDELPDTAPASLRAADSERSSSDLMVWAAFMHFGR